MEEVEANSKLLSDVSQLEHPFQNKMIGLKDRTHDIKAMLVEKKTLLKENSDRIRRFNDNANSAENCLNTIEIALSENALDTIDAEAIGERIEALEVN